MPMKTRCDELCDLVLARCDEDLSWISTAARNYQRVRLYNKCRSPVPSDVRRLANLRVIETPNIGSNDFAILNHVITNFNDLAPLTVFCEAGQPSVCEPNMVVRPLGLTKRWPVPYAPLAQFAAKPPYTFNPWKHHMDLGGFSSRWWGNCSYGYVHTPGRSHQFISSGYDNYAAWLRHTLGADLATDLLSNRKAYLVLQGFFAAERDNLRRYPLQLYLAMARQQRHPNEEVDHFIERCVNAGSNPCSKAAPACSFPALSFAF